MRRLFSALMHTSQQRAEPGLGIPPLPALSVGHYEAQLELILELAPPVFSFIFGVPSREVLSACRELSIARSSSRDITR